MFFPQALSFSTAVLKSKPVLTGLKTQLGWFILILHNPGQYSFGNPREASSFSQALTAPGSTVMVDFITLPYVEQT